MKTNEMTPFGSALLACYEGETEAVVIIRRDDGVEAPLPMKYFFRPETEFSEIENEVIAQCRGNILDIGAGSGIHSLVLQSKGHKVTAIDISPEAVEVMKRQGLQDARVTSIFDFQSGGYDTLLLLGHGIGMMGDLAGLDKFLAFAKKLVNDEGQILLDSLDVTKTTDTGNLAYQQANLRDGRYVGEIRFQMGFRGMVGPFLSWLHVDPETLAHHAFKAGWHSEIVVESVYGDYLARLVKKE
jgi:SAM-dependent methyltransferase